MGINMFSSNKIDNKLLIIGGAVAIICLVALPSIFTLAKIAIGLAMLSVGIIAFKIVLKAISNATKENEADKNHVTRDKIINIATGFTSILIGGLSLLIMAQAGLIAVCAAFTALALYEYVKSEGKEAAKEDQPTNSNEKDGFVDMAEENDPVQSEEKSRYIIDKKFDEIADSIVKHTTSFLVSSIEKFTPPKNLQTESHRV